MIQLLRSSPLFLLIFLSGCHSKPSSFSSKKTNPNVFRYPIVENPLTFDPALVQDMHTLDVMQQVYESLVSLTAGTEIKPRLASRWEVQKGGREYVFYLKKGVTFHSGREMTAYDVKWSIDRSTNPVLASPTAGNYLGGIAGVYERMQGKALSVSGVQVLDRYTIKFLLKEPDPFFLGKLTYPVSAVISSADVPFDAPVTHIKQVVATGPFRIVSYAPGQLIRLEAYGHYHGGAPKIPMIERPVIKDVTTQLTKYKLGSLDYMQLSRRELCAVNHQDTYKKHLHYQKRPGIWYLCLNQKACAPFQDIRVRKAFAMAINKERIVNEVLGGVHEVAEGMIPWTVPGYRRRQPTYPFDPARAKQLLSEAGYQNPRDFPSIELEVREDHPDSKALVEAVVMQLRKNLGIRIFYRNYDYQTFLEKRNRGTMAFFCNSWIADYLDPSNFLSFLLSSKGPGNCSGYQNLKFDALCQKADRLKMGAERIDLYHQAEDLAIKDVAWIPIYFSRDIELVHPRVHGLQRSPFGNLAHSKVSLGTEGVKVGRKL